MRRWLQPYRCEDPRAGARLLRNWYRGSPGRELLAVEQGVLEQVLPRLFGYHLLQVGIPVATDLLVASKVSHKMVLEEAGERTATLNGGYSRLCGAAAGLPVGADTLDVVLLPHTLEFQRDPHQVLREVDRVLIPEGHVVILGFNPWSLWGMVRLASGWRRRPPWCGHFYGATRLQDWLALLGFDTVHCESYFFRPPFTAPGMLERLGFLEGIGARLGGAMGGGFILVAKKRVSTLTPIRPRWRSRRGLMGGLARPTTMRRTTQDDDRAV